ncbi:MAG: 50S ribosomal protein L16 [Nitrososphaerales archaeon]
MKGRNYREHRGMPYVRREFIAGTPQSKIAKFTGGATGDYDFKLELISNGKVQVRHNALEAARLAANKVMSEIGETAFYSLLKVYPHVILRENKMIATAGADRLQEGMRNAFGKAIGLAARVTPGQVILELHVKADALEKAKDAMKAATSKLPMTTSINIILLKEEMAKLK